MSTWSSPNFKNNAGMRRVIKHPHRSLILWRMLFIMCILLSCSQRIGTNTIKILIQTRRKLSASQDVSQVRVLVYIAKTNPPESALLLWLKQIRRLKIFFLMVLNTRNWTQTIPPFTNPKLLIGTENTSLPSNPSKKILANFLFLKMSPLPTSKF